MAGTVPASSAGQRAFDTNIQVMTMKMNAFLRLINALACGAIVVGATHSCDAQSASRDDVTFGSLQPADENGNVIGYETQQLSNEATTSTQTQAPYSTDDTVYQEPVIQDQGGVIVVPQGVQPMQQLGVEIPLTEVEIPGTSYYVGPDGQRIDESELNAGQGIAGQGIVGEAPIEGLSPTPFSPDAVYDGTQAFPMGTFPMTPFGERILSEEPAGQSPDTDSTADVDIPGEVVDGEGRVVDATPTIVPPNSDDSAVDATPPVVPPNSDDGVADATPIIVPPNSDDSVDDATDTIEPPTSGDSVVVAPGEMDEPTSSRNGMSSSPTEPSELENSKSDDSQASASSGEAKQMVEEEQSRLKQRLRDALAEKDQLDTKLQAAVRKSKALTALVDRMKSSGGKKLDASNAQLETLKDDLKKTKLASDKSIKELKSKLNAVEGEKEKSEQAAKKSRGQIDASISKLNDTIKSKEIRFVKKTESQYEKGTKEVSIKIESG